MNILYFSKHKKAKNSPHYAHRLAQPKENRHSPDQTKHRAFPPEEKELEQCSMTSKTLATVSLLPLKKDSRL